MNIKEILDELKNDKDLTVTFSGNSDIEVKGISNDSRKINRGCLFAARKGSCVNSNEFIQGAIYNGAVGVLTDDIGFDLKLNAAGAAIPVIKTNNALKAYALISRLFFKNPGNEMTLIGITGTNGKTTTTFLIKSILKAYGFDSGIIGTINYEIGEKSVVPSSNTTPDAYELNKMLREMRNEDIKFCTMEISSHSLVQDRVYGLPLDVAIFSNLTRDHLDYHENMEEYFRAKRKLFFEILDKSTKPRKFAVINNDDDYGKRLIGEIKARLTGSRGNAPSFNLLTYGLGKGSDIFAGDVEYLKEGLRININLPGKKKIEVFSNLIGGYNVYNILAAVSAAIAIGVPEKFIESGISNLKEVSGRVERINVKNKKAPLVCIDYAHTDDALERVLKALKEITRGRLISVFGCGGDRDKGKRPLMGKHSSDIADITIITSDNPRNENPSLIIKEIEKGIENADFVGPGMIQEAVPGRHVYFIIEERAKAISMALSISGDSDTVLIAGKGHEDYMIIKNEKSHFSDKEEVLKFYEDSI